MMMQTEAESLGNHWSTSELFPEPATVDKSLIAV